MTQPELEQELGRYFAQRAPGRCDRERELCGHVAGELDAGEAASFRIHLEGCAECRANLADLGTAELAWTAPARSALRRRWPQAVIGTSLAAAAALLFVIHVQRYLVDPPSKLIAKGASFQLHVAVDRDGRRFRLSDGAQLETGDRLGFFYTAPEAVHLTVLFVDEAGEISRLFPALEPRSAFAEPGAEVRIPDGAILSPGGGCEWVVGLFSGTPLESSDASQAAARMWAGRTGCNLGPVRLTGVQAHVTRLQR